MKNAIILLLIFFHFFGFSQSTIVEYKAKPIPNERLDGLLLNIDPNFYEKANDLNFVLTFDKELSYFALEKKIDRSDYEVPISRVGYTGEFFIKNDSIYKLVNNNVTSNIIVKEKIDFKWELVNETKIINNFLCFKAVYNQEKTFSRKETNTPIKKTFTTIAWYCPEIASTYGPLNFCNLPGLIMEVQTNTFLYGVSSIKFNQPVDVIRLPDYKIISVEEYNAKILDFRENIGK